LLILFSAFFISAPRKNIAGLHPDYISNNSKRRERGAAGGRAVAATRAEKRQQKQQQQQQQQYQQKQQQQQQYAQQYHEHTKPKRQIDNEGRKAVESPNTDKTERRKGREKEIQNWRERVHFICPTGAQADSCTRVGL
jgi:transcription initiation factor TFIID subunit TAF12